MDIRKQYVYPLMMWVAVLVAVPKEDEFTQQIADMANSEPQELRIESLRPKVAFDENSKDPFVPLIVKPKPAENSAQNPSSPDTAVAPPAPVVPPTFDIQGVIWGGALNQAIINNAVVKEGDTVSGAKIIKIGKAGISVLYQDKEFSYASPASVSRVSDANPKGGSDEKSK